MNTKKLAMNFCLALLGLCVIYPKQTFATDDNQGEVKDKKPERFTFNTEFMKQYDSNVDLDYLTKEKITPGLNYVELTVNGRRLGGEKIRFDTVDGHLTPCISRELLVAFKIDSQYYPVENIFDGCRKLEKIIPGSVVVFEKSESALNITIPQIYLNHASDDYIDPALWDDGVNAFKISTNANVASYMEKGKNAVNSLYVGAGTSFNLGSWRFNTNDNLYFTNGKSSYNRTLVHGDAYAETAVRSLQSRFSVGDISTSGEFFESLSIRGASLSTWDPMLPISMRNYLPSVRGIADTNATVTLVQNNNVIYETNVPPGEFELREFYPASYGGDIVVNIKESDGRVQSFTVPYANVPQLLRQGYLRYSSTVGQIQLSGVSASPMLFEGMLQYGIASNTTVYSGVQQTDFAYKALKTGVAFNTPVGAISSDMTWSYTDFKDDEKEHCSWTCNAAIQLNYSKYVNQSDTAINLSFRRAMNDDYYTLSDALYEKEFERVERSRDRVDVTLSQQLPDYWGSLYLSGYMGRTWHKDDSNYNKSYQVSYRNAYRNFNYSVSLTQYHDSKGYDDRQIYINFSVPLHRSATDTVNLVASGGYNSNNASLRTAVTGTTGEERENNFNAYINTREKVIQNSGVSFSRNTDMAATTASLSKTSHAVSAAIGLSSGVIIHSGGMNYSQGMGDSIAIVNSQGAEGARIYPDNLARIQSNGFGIVRNLIPYQYNELYLDPEGSSFELETEDVHKKIIPTRGAILLLNIESTNEPMKLYRISHSSGLNIPFGTSVKDNEGQVVGLVGQGARVMLPQNNQTSRYSIEWQKDKSVHHCSLTISPVPESVKTPEGLSHQDVHCLSEGNKNEG